MKITSLSAEVLEIKEGRGPMVLFGCVALVMGLAIALFGGILVGLGLILAGPFFILASASTTFTASWRTGQIHYERKKLFGNKRFDYAIALVQQIIRYNALVNDSTTDSDGYTRNDTVLKCQPFILFGDGRQTELFPGMKPSNEALELARGVAKFLNVPMQDARK